MLTNQNRNIMKKYLFLILLMLVGACTTFTFTSCSDDDDDTEAAYNMILGSWQENDTDEGIWVWTFGEGGKGICEVSDGNIAYSFEFTYAFDGRTLIVSGEEDGETYTDMYAVTFHGNVMVCVGEDDGETYTTTFTRVN